jgi:hypothetical protein
MYGFKGRCGEYVEGLKIYHGQIHFGCPKYCKGLTVSEDDVKGSQECLCDDCEEVQDKKEEI